MVHNGLGMRGCHSILFLFLTFFVHLIILLLSLSSTLPSDMVLEGRRMESLAVYFF
jgi:hypothetical protein